MNNATPYHTLFQITTFSEQVCAFWLKNKDNWAEDMTRKDLKAENHRVLDNSNESNSFVTAQTEKRNNFLNQHPTIVWD